MKQIRLIIAAFLVITPFAAHADLITISGTASSDGVWDITLVNGLFADNQSLLESQEWWGDFDLAQVFSFQTADLFGLALNECSDCASGSGSWGALFAYNPSGVGASSIFYGFGGSSFDPQLYFCLSGNCESLMDVSGPVYAVANRVSVPEPGTLALLGIGLFGLGLLRRRLKV